MWFRIQKFCQERLFIEKDHSCQINQTLPTHTAEKLRLIESAKLPVGGWVGGDSWFGSMTTAVEVMRRFCVNY
jgi:hypothetical protein